MIESENREERAELIRLMRAIAREVAYEIMDEHLEDYEHKNSSSDVSLLEDSKVE